MASKVLLRNVTNFAILISAAISLCSPLGPVPILVWSNEREISQVKDTAVGYQYSSGEVKSLLHHYLGPLRTTILFMQDQLSLDDLTAFRGKSLGTKSFVFSNIQSIIQSNTYNLIPSMSQDEEQPLVSYLKRIFSNFEEIYSSDIDSWNYDKSKLGKNVLYVFHLPPVKGSTEKGKLSILSRNDDLVGKITSQFQKNFIKYVAILSALEPSEIINKFESESIIDGMPGIRRHLLGSSIPSSEGKLFNFNGCVFLFAKSIDLAVGQSKVNVVNASYTLSGHCTSNETSVSITFGKDLPTNITQFELRMSFAKLENTDWICTNMDITYSGNLTGTSVTGVNVLFPSCPEKILAPRDMSYSCGDLSLTNGTTLLSFSHFQVQPFGLKNNRFSNAFDCIGFFTSPILTGLFVTALLISIAFGGIIAMMGISTMDRFDDPKGPTIQVPHE